MQSNLTIRPMLLSDNPQVANVIRTVMPEFGCVGEGYSIEDPEVDAMFEAYAADNACFYVIVDENDIPLGCGGVAPLDGGDLSTCELQKMYFLKEARGQGMGRALMQLLLAEAQRLGFSRVYLETVIRMESANAMYQNFGFQRISGQLGCTGHSSCDVFYIKEL